MKRICVLFVVVLLTACASTGGGSKGTPQMDTTRAQAIAKIHTELAAAYYEREQYAVALHEIAVALQAESGYAPAYSVRALIRMALREDEQADADFRLSVQLDSSNSETRNNYGWFLCQRGREKESLRQFQEALKNPLYATPEMAYANLGMCSMKAGLPQEAESNFQRALVIRPGMQEALYGLATLAYERGEYAGAKSYLQRFSRGPHELTAEQLWLAVRIERKMRDRNSEASFALQLRKRYPESPETQLLLQGQ